MPNLLRQLAANRPTQVHAWHHQEDDLADFAELYALVMLCQPEVVLHLAAQPLVRRSYRDPLSTWATNVQGALHLLDALKPLEHPCSVVMVTTDRCIKTSSGRMATESLIASEATIHTAPVKLLQN